MFIDINIYLRDFFVLATYLNTSSLFHGAKCSFYPSEKIHVPLCLLQKFEDKTGDESGDEGLGFTPMAITRETTCIVDSDSDGGWPRN